MVGILSPIAGETRILSTSAVTLALPAALDNLGSGRVDHSQKMTVAARVRVEKKAVAQRL
jgi:hypothetical protein